MTQTALAFAALAVGIVAIYAVIRHLLATATAAAEQRRETEAEPYGDWPALTSGVPDVSRLRLAEVGNSRHSAGGFASLDRKGL